MHSAPDQEIQRATPAESPSTNPRPSVPSRYPYILRILALLCLGLVLRLIPLPAHTFWYDEIYTVLISQHTLREMAEITSRDVHPPLYYALLHAAMKLCWLLGERFCDIGWLRLVSIIPGLLLCYLGYRAARRHWPGHQALWVLALFVTSPPLVFYSYELRNYSVTQLLLLASTLALLELRQAGTRRQQGTWATLYALLMSLALYTHNISTIYYATHGFIYLIEFRRARGAYRAFGLLALSLPFLLYLPWLPVVLRQNQLMRAVKLDWLPPASYSDIFSTLFFYFPCGIYDHISLRTHVWPRFLSVGTFMIYLGFAIPFMRRYFHVPGSCPPPDRGPAPIPTSRLFLYSMLMVVVPLGIAFAASRFGAARIFLPTRYNALCLPFYLLCLAGLLLMLPRWRRFSLCLLLLAACSFSIHCQRNRGQERDDLRNIASYAGQPLLWSDDQALPWLGRWRDQRLGSINDLLNQPAQFRQPVYIMTHNFLMQGQNLAGSQARLMDSILIQSENHGLTKRHHPSTPWAWAYLHEIAPENQPRIASLWHEAWAKHQAVRQSIAGGQVLLPDDPALRQGGNWGMPEVTHDLAWYAWSLDGRSAIRWNGPQQPGEYRCVIQLLRYTPYPEPEVTIRWRPPGKSKWKEVIAPLGLLTLEKDVTVIQPAQPLRVEFKFPTWIPAQVDPASSDQRYLGFMFLSLQMRPKETSYDETE